MIDPKYSLKYSFPHSVVHIVDNSMYTGETVVEPAQDPSIFSTIVVTGLPMGEDNRIITVNRSDVLNTGFGISTLTTSDINKYSQAVEYPMALLQQNVPVKLMRITPDDATYSVAVIMIQWKKKEYIKNNKFEVRYRILPEAVINAYFGDLSEYKNVTRLNKAIVAKFNTPKANDDTLKEYILLTATDAPTDWTTATGKYYEYESGEFVEVPENTEYAANTYYSKEEVWNQRVFMTVISAGRGLVYNRMRFFINKIAQTRRQTAVTYNFGTIDTLNGLTVENFSAALINNTNQALLSDAINSSAAKIDTVNIAVAKRVEGSSVLTPTVNEPTVQEVFNAYMEFFKERKETGDTEYENYGAAYDAIYQSINSAKFDIIYGMFTYKDSTFKLPYFQVDMYDSDIPKLPADQRVKIQKVYTGTGTDDTLPYKAIETYGATIDAAGNIAGNVDVAAPAAVFETKIKQAISRTFNDNNTPAPGDVYIGGPNSKQPYLVLVTGVNLKNGAVSTIPFTKVKSRDNSTTVPISCVFSGISPLWITGSTGHGDGTKADFIKKLNTQNHKFVTDEAFIVTGIYKGTADSALQFSIYYAKEVSDDGKLVDISNVGGNVYERIDYNSSYLDISEIDAQICRLSQMNLDPLPAAFSRLGALFIDDVADDFSPHFIDDTSTFEWRSNGTKQQPCYLAYFNDDGNPMFKTVSAYATYPNYISQQGYYSGHTTVFRGFEAPPSGIIANITTDIIGKQYDVLVFDVNANPEALDEEATSADYIFRCNIQNAVNNTYRVTYAAGIDVPSNYYVKNYGDILYTAANMSTYEGGVPMILGSTGFFDDDMSDIEFKWRYSALLVKAFRGEIDPRILSPVRVPAFYMFDAGFNTVVGMNVLPYTTPSVDEVIYASTIFTDDEKEAILYDKSLINNIKSYKDIDVKKAMYDLMIERVYQRIPEDKRPVGPGSGLSLHLDSGITSAETAIAINNSFKQRFDNPNASWDIGGYVDANNGVSYTYLMQIIRNCFRHYRNYTINKPYVGDYSALNRQDYLSFFPDLDATDWEMRELYYNSGGNAWIMDVNGNLTRRSQRSLYREETGTSDLYQESNMRTLTQFVYLIQSEIDHYLLEYNDDGVIKTMQETVNNKFAGWAGNLVESYDIAFTRDINTDGGEILICNVNVVFRGLILRVPIIVNVNRRNTQ